jgi:hypothetical protein
MKKRKPQRKKGVKITSKVEYFSRRLISPISKFTNNMKIPTNIRTDSFKQRVSIMPPITPAIPIKSHIILKTPSKYLITMQYINEIKIVATAKKSVSIGKLSIVRSAVLSKITLALLRVNIINIRNKLPRL